MTTVPSPYDGSFQNKVSLDETVKEKQTLCRIGAGGTNLPVKSLCDGVIQKIFPAEGDIVHEGDQLYEIGAPPVTPPIA